MAKNDLAQTYLATYLWKQWVKKIQGQNILHRRGRQKAGPVPGWKGGRMYRSHPLDQRLNLCRGWSCCNLPPHLLTPSLCQRPACSPTVHPSRSPDNEAKALGGRGHVSSVVGFSPVASYVSPSCNDSDRGREAATVLCAISVRLRQGKAVGPLKLGQTGSGVGFALCGSLAGDIPGSMLRQVGCCEHPQMENWRSWGSLSSVHSFPEDLWPLFPFIGYCLPMSCPSLCGIPTTFVLCGGELEMDIYLAVTAPKPQSRSEAGHGHALPGPLSFSTFRGWAHPTHFCLVPARCQVQSQTFALLYRLSPEG